MKFWPDDYTRLHKLNLSLKMCFGLWPMFFANPDALWGGWFAAGMWIAAIMALILMDVRHTNRILELSIAHQRIMCEIDEAEQEILDRLLEIHREQLQREF